MGTCWFVHGWFNQGYPLCSWVETATKWPATRLLIPVNDHQSDVSSVVKYSHYIIIIASWNGLWILPIDYLKFRLMYYPHFKVSCSKWAPISIPHNPILGYVVLLIYDILRNLTAHEGLSFYHICRQVKYTKLLMKSLTRHYHIEELVHGLSPVCELGMKQHCFCGTVGTNSS